MPQAICLKISGKVQGVNLRYKILDFAEKEGITGWVRNETDGTVSCCAICDEDKIQKFINWLKGNFSISEIQTDKMEIDAEYNKFEIRY